MVKKELLADVRVIEEKSEALAGATGCDRPLLLHDMLGACCDDLEQARKVLKRII